MTSDPDVLVQMIHMRRLRYCARGVRDFFAAHNLDYSRFLIDGIDAKELAATGDAMALAAVEEATRGRQ